MDQPRENKTTHQNKKPTSAELNKVLELEAIKKTYTRQKTYTPLRFLAFPPLHKIENFNLENYELLRVALFQEENLLKIKSNNNWISTSELIHRVCFLLLALVDGGGLNLNSPIKQLLKTKIDLNSAQFGFLSFLNNTSRTNLDEEKETETNMTGMRQPLYAVGRFYLASFIKIRLTKQKAKDGDRLIPEIDFSKLNRTELKKNLPWLVDFPSQSKLTWNVIFRYFLKYLLWKYCRIKQPITWNNITQIANWRLLSFEKYPFLSSYRRRLFLTTSLPDGKLIAISKLEPLEFRKIARNPSIINSSDLKNFPSNITKTETETLRADSVNFQFKFIDEDFDDEIIRYLITLEQKTKFQLVNQVLSHLNLDSGDKKTIRQNFKSNLEEIKFDKENEIDLKNLLNWTSENLKSKEISTSYSYSVRVLRTLKAISYKAFADWETDDVAEFLENYTTNSSVNNVRTALKLFHNYLIDKNLAAEDSIKWTSRTLQKPKSFLVRDIISNNEYKGVRTAIKQRESENKGDLAILTLLKRCGLRANEVSELRIADFKGFEQWCLQISFSKTNAGLRKLPLYLLLSEEEIIELKDFIGIRSKTANQNDYLLIDENNQPFTPAKIGEKVEKLLSFGGIKGETAHGLRHSFATSLFLSFWINLTETRRNNQSSNKIHKTLNEYARPQIEGRAVTQLLYIQYLMGHADLRVTFERYIHFLEFVCLDSIIITESEKETSLDSMKSGLASNLLGMDTTGFCHLTKKTASQLVETVDLAKIALNRLYS